LLFLAGETVCLTKDKTLKVSFTLDQETGLNVGDGAEITEVRLGTTSRVLLIWRWQS
jgi:hypothetical protein